MANVTMTKEQMEFVRQFAEARQIEGKKLTTDQAIEIIFTKGISKAKAEDHYAKKMEQARKFKEGEIKTAPSFQFRKNKYADLAVKPEPKAEKPKGKGGKKTPAPKGKGKKGGKKPAAAPASEAAAAALE
jgi:hypothetical protein